MRSTFLCIAFLFLTGCSDSPTFDEKDWHVSPSGDPRSSTLYPFVEWDIVQQVKDGMCQAEAEDALGASFQFYHHPVNAIVFSEHPTGRDLEVAFKLSSEQCIEDISYKYRLGG